MKLNDICFFPIVDAGERLEDKEVEAFCKECCDAEDEEGNIPYERMFHSINWSHLLLQIYLLRYEFQSLWNQLYKTVQFCYHSILASKQPTNQTRPFRFWVRPEYFTPNTLLNLYLLKPLIQFQPTAFGFFKKLLSKKTKLLLAVDQQRWWHNAGGSKGMMFLSLSKKIPTISLQPCLSDWWPDPTQRAINHKCTIDAKQQHKPKQNTKKPKE